jgi:two-component system, sensor histidine kinase
MTFLAADAAEKAAPPRTPFARGAAASQRAGQSLQARITAAILLTAVTVLFVGCTLFMLEQHRAERVAERKINAQLVQVLGAGMAKSAALGHGAEVQRDLQLLRYFERVSFGEVRAPGGLRVDYRRTGPASAHGRAAETFRSELLWQGRPAGEFVISARPLDGGHRLSHFVAMGGALFFAATALALFLGRWLAARITTPVARLAQAMEMVGQGGDFHVRVEAGSADEIGRLTLRFNELMARLQVKDVALRRTLGELVEARDEAQAANLAKSQFLANMSHEIRTPLNGVLAMAQILARSPLETAQREQVEVIHQSGETLLALLNDILDVSKIEAGKLELEMAAFSTDALAESAVASFAAVAQRKRLSLTLEIAADGGGVRVGDAGRLRQILNNLLSNALKFTEAGGVSLHVAGEGPGGADGLRLTVRDSGIGIAPEKQSLLFQKFTQLDASTTRRFGGTGLGLAICRELAELMGGRILVDSVPGVGSTFEVLLPAPRSAQLQEAAPEAAAIPAVETAAAPAEAEDVEAPPPLRVLAAEDNATNQLVLSTVMQMFGVELSLVEDGQQAVDAWRTGGFDLILMDIQMPRMDGVAATRLIRSEEARENRPRTPILALSANALTHQVESYLAAGMDGHVAKPIELAKLQAALEQVFAAPAEAPAAEDAAAA